MSDLSNLDFMACQWRKANAIHKWFVDRVQEGRDDCGTYYVSHEDIRTLIRLCKETLNYIQSCPNKEVEIVTGWNKAGEIKEKITVKDVGPEIDDLLPSQSGFFFGSTEYDDYYIDDLKYTIEKLEAALEKFKDCEFEYSSSW